MLTDHYTTEFTVKRNIQTGRITTFAVVGTGRGHVQPATSEYQLKQAGQYHQNFVMFTNYVIEIGDVVVVGTDEYKVHGLQAHNFRTGTRHREVHMHKA